jgi:hypothetical protein
MRKFNHLSFNFKGLTSLTLYFFLWSESSIGIFIHRNLFPQINFDRIKDQQKSRSYMLGLLYSADSMLEFYTFDVVRLPQLSQ